jgi:opacity protein-like surface antigen
MKKTLTVAALAATLVSLAASRPAQAEPGYGGAFNFHMGGFFPSGDSAFWEVNEDAFTLDESDFNGFILGASYVAPISNFVEFGMGVDFYYESVRAADRNFTDQFGDPILHDTRLSIIPLTADLRLLPAGRFKRTGADGRRLVRRPVPYVGGGIGMDYWTYEEEGDFVASDLSIVYDRLKDSGVAFETHVFAGIEFPLSPAWNLTFEARHSWADDTPGGAFEFVNPNELDLGGTSVVVGGSWRF